MSHNGNCEYKLENTIYNEENKKKNRKGGNEEWHTKK